MAARTEAGMMRSERLLLRRWRAGDRAPFAALNADPAVMEHFPEPLSHAASDALVERIEAGFERHGFGLWALEVAATGEFVGFAGLSVPSFQAAFLPGVEIGWRLARGAWGHGYATEAALRALEFGFGEAGLEEVVSFAAAPNERSQAVMRRIGMRRDPDGDFDHPALPVGHRLRRHVLWRLDAASWRTAAPASRPVFSRRPPAGGPGAGTSRR